MSAVVRRSAEHDRKLADVVVAQELDRVGDRVVGADRDDMRDAAAALVDQAAEALRPAEAGEEAVLAHPVVVVDLGEVAAAAVRQKHDHQRVRVVDLGGRPRARPRRPARPNRRSGCPLRGSRGGRP